MNKTSSRILGARGEKEAEAYLRRQGYTILERNFRYRRFEIDLIATRDDWTVFVEVKTRTGMRFGAPESFVDGTKISNMLEAAAYYREHHESKFWRYDIIAIYVKEGEVRIRHFEDAVWA